MLDEVDAIGACRKLVVRLVGLRAAGTRELADAPSRRLSACEALGLDLEATRSRLLEQPSVSRR